MEENKELFKLADEKGFDKWFSAYSEKYHHLDGWRSRDEYLDEVELPNDLLYTLIQKWLRDTHNIIVTIEPYSLSKNPSYQHRIDYFTNIWRTKSMSVELSYSNYEEALEEGLIKAIKLIK